MMNVLLVDDEPWVLEGLRSIVNWDKYGFQVCGEAENGNSAWSMIEQLKPDLVFTDIHMPSVGGLELIDRSMQELAKPPRFVILSGYDQFEYARRALEQRVEDYLLKPIDEDEIGLVLEQMSLKIQKQHASEKQYRLERSLYVSCIINRLLQGEEDIELENQVAELLNCNVNEEVSWNCLLIETEITEEQLKTLIQKQFGSVLPEFFVDSEGRMGLLASDRHGLNQLGFIGSRLYEECSAEISMIVAFGHSHGGVKALRSAYEKAVLASKWKRYQTGGGIVDYNDLPQNISTNKVNKQALTALTEIIISDTLDDLEPAIDTLLAEPLTNLPASNIEYVRIQLLALEMDVLKKLKELGGDGNQFMNTMQQSIGMLTEMHCYSAFRKYASILCTQGSQVLSEQRRRSECNTTYQVIQYVNQEFRQKLQLQELAQQFHMNSNYLGQVFKQQTGKTFREYLNDKRMEEAKRLLRQGRLSIAEVAANSGYHNTDYFVSQFKRMTGVSPSIFRKQE